MNSQGNSLQANDESVNNNAMNMEEGEVTSEKNKISLEQMAQNEGFMENLAQFMIKKAICARSPKMVDLHWDGKLNVTECDVSLNRFVIKTHTFHDSCIP